MDNCLFCKIARGDIPARKVYEDDEIFAFHDINPARPVHFLMIPKRHITSLSEAQASDAPVLGKMLTLANRLATEQGSPNGFRIIINTGEIGHQEVQHVHIHVIGGPDPVGPMIKRLPQG